MIAAKNYTKQLLDQENAIPNVNWEERGPNNVSGRTRSILIDAGDASGNTVFAGSVGGGIWRTTDGGTTWSSINDFFQNLSIGSIAQDPSNANIIYFGTGEGYGNSDQIQGLGIWKSTDGGLTFTQLASTNNDANFFAVNSMEILQSGGTNAVIAANSQGGGLQRSIDGGVTWSQVLAGNGVDLTVSPNGDIYAGMDTDGIYKSTDQGASWTEVYNAVSPDGRIELGAAPSDDNVVYALIENRANGGIPTIRRTTNAGTSWPLVTNPVWEDQNCGNPNPDWTRSQDWYDLIVAVDPNNASRAFCGGVDLFVTNNGGGSWTQISSWASACGRQLVHADQHELVFAGNSSDVLWSGNDGGVHKTTNATAAIPTFEFKGVGYNVTQFYAGDLHPAEGNDYFLAGAQDNGTQQFIGPGLLNTNEATGGDGGFCHIDQSNGDIQITSFTNNNYRVSTNGGASFGAGPGANTGRFINPTDYDDELGVFYGASGGGNFFRWNDPTTGGTSTTTVSVNAIGGTATHVRTSPNVSDRVYFGTSGRVVRVNGASTGTTNTGTTIFTGTGTISCVEIEVGDEDHMLVTLSNYGVVSIFESTNATAATPTWTNVENNLPDMPVRWAIFNPHSADQAMIATELGVWSTDNLNGAATDWTPTNANLANTRVDMLKTRTSDNVVIAATHGRGLFSTIAFNNKLFFSKSVVSVANANDELTYEIKIFNNKTTAVTNVVVTDVLDAGLEYVTGSLTCGSIMGNTITINEASIASGATVTCTFRAKLPIDNFSIVTFEDDMESGTGNWTATNGQGAGMWSLSSANPRSPSNAWFAPNTGAEDNTEYLTLDAMMLNADSELGFWHAYDTEFGWDGGIVEISINGGSTWTDLGPHIITNGYNSVLGTNQNLDIAGRPAFSGDSDGYILSRVDLSSFTGQMIQIRFLFGEDDNTSVDGWHIDDVQIYEAYAVPNLATITTAEGDNLSDTTSTLVFECVTGCFSCVDGIMNGAETGVDCGGGLCVPCDCTEVNPSKTYDNTTIVTGTLDRLETSVILKNSINVTNGSNVRLLAGQKIDVNGTLDIATGAAVEMDADDCNVIPSVQGKGEKQ